MKKIKTIFSACFFVLAITLFLPFSGPVLAEMQSSNFQIKSDALGSFGADSTSANFQLGDTGGETGGELLSGSGKNLWGGFWHNLLGGPDADGDGIIDSLDNCPNDANANQNDSDNDGVGNVCDNCPSDSNSNQNDSDHDGVGNVCDNCPSDSNSNQNDSDNDGVGNSCDNCPNNSNSNQSDTDNDGVGNSCDNCPTVANSNQVDSNSNGVGDACEPPVNNDTDNDGILNNVDNCPMVYNPGQEDMDHDGIGDACDSDMDGDGVINASDNCPSNANSNQADTDGDGTGDVCDSDLDGDGVSNGSDNCPSISNFDQNDQDADGIGDACDSDLDGDGINNSSDNCPTVANTSQSDRNGNGVGDACDAGQDSDGDGIENNVDNCPLIVNPGQEDSDGDGIGDACDNDFDNDGYPDNVDNCPNIANPDQKDADNDGVGDACDPDMDGDGAPNSSDNCPLVSNADQKDSNKNGVGDACDAGQDSDGDGLENNVDNCPYVSNPDQKDVDKDGIGDACDSNNNTPVGIVRIKKLKALPEEQGVVAELTNAAENVQQIGKEIEQKAAERENTIATASTAVAAVSVLPVVIGANSFKDLLLILTNSLGSLFGLIFRRRRDWGIVYDVDTGEPVPLVSVEIINSLGRSLEKKVTDKNGSYVFLVPQGKYSLAIEKEGYHLAKKDDQVRTVYSDNYYGGELDIQNPDMISFNVPLCSENVGESTVSSQKLLAQRSWFSRLAFSFSALLFYAGFVVSIGSLFVLPNKKMAILVVLAYVLGALLRRFALEEKGWGRIIGKAGENSPFATVRAFNKEDGEFVARTISDELGRYSLILRKGKYNLAVDGVKGEKWTGDINVNHTTVVKKKIKLTDNPSLFAETIGKNEPPPLTERPF